MPEGSSLFKGIVIIIAGAVNSGIEENNILTVCLDIQGFELTTKLLCTCIAKIMEILWNNLLAIILKRENECYSEKGKYSGICC